MRGQRSLRRQIHQRKIFALLVLVFLAMKGGINQGRDAAKERAKWPIFTNHISAGRGGPRPASKPNEPFPILSQRFGDQSNRSDRLSARLKRSSTCSSCRASPASSQPSSSKAASWWLSWNRVIWTWRQSPYFESKHRRCAVLRPPKLQRFPLHGNGHLRIEQLPGASPRYCMQL